MLVLALGGILAMAFSAVASAKWDTFRFGDIVFKADGGVTPKALPKKKMAPVTVNVRGQISSASGGHPAAFREAVIDFDKNGSVNTTGLPVCKGGELEARDTKAAKRVCGKSVVGSGSGNIQISFPEQKPLPVTAPITVFSGGQKGGKITLYIHTFITVPVPSAVVTTVTIQKKGQGLHTISKIPVIAGGSGSVLDFRFKVGKKYNYKGKKMSYLEAKCPDGVFKVNSPKAIFKNEARIPGVSAQTVLKGGLAVPCTPKG